MKSILFLILMIGVSIQSYAQKELNKEYRSIPTKDQKINEVNTPIESNPKTSPPPIIENPDSLVINPEELFMDTNLYKRESNTEGVFYRRNQYLGGFRTKTFVSTIRYRDAATVDGDKIKVYLNDKVIKPEVTLDGEFQGFKINLIKGINKIDFEALNEGFASPNTAEFQVYDDNGTVIEASQWNVGTGYKATIILYKE
ncbi:hypothetical protein [Flavobacterium piscis]|uniref:Secreted protein n=1 Tax=Flavobacterium piscis TaxID=1114874 RepID=A0ABU1YBE5_9FLAO|nr:hypothetical protein [Flavobacterium piscis]MDR7211562.1 hypothetical protein [Flavobacterium piscis]